MHALFTPCAAVVVVTCILTGCNGNQAKPNSSQAGKLVAECAQSAMIGPKHIRYTGPFPLSAGQVFVRLGDDLVLPGPTATTMFGDPLPKNLLLTTQGTGNCSQTSTSKSDLKTELGVTVKTLPVSGELKNDFAKGEVTSVTVDGFEWIFVDPIEYGSQVAKLSEQAPVRQAIAKGNVEAAIGVLKVKNYRAEVDLSRSSDTGLKAKYSGPLPQALSGELGAGVSYAASGNGKITLSIPGDVYVAGVFRSLGKGGQVESGNEPASSTQPPRISETSVQRPN